MIDNERLTDAELAARVAAHDAELAKLIRARLRRLRLARVVSPLETASPLPPIAAAIATNGGDGQPRHF